MPVVNLTPAFMANKVQCPPGLKKIELCDAQVRGLFIECLSSATSQPSWNVRLKDTNGKTRTRRLGTLADISLDDARERAAVMKMQTRNGHAAKAEELAQGITLNRFMQDHYRPFAKIEKRSFARDDQLYRRLGPRFGQLPLPQITRRQVDELKGQLLQEGLSRATVNHHLQLMRRLLNLAVRWEMLDRNVLKGIDLLDLDNQVENYLSDEQAHRLAEVLKADSNKQVGLALLFLLCTGARLREALDAEWKQVNRETGVWSIPATNSKSKKMIRRPMNDEALAILDALGTEGKSQYLFPSPATGRPYTTITRVWYRIRKAAGLPGNVRIHDLRHTFASMVVRKGGTLLMAQHLLGHSDPRTTLRYAHMDMETLRQASNAISIRSASRGPAGTGPGLQ